MHSHRTLMPPLRLVTYAGVSLLLVAIVCLAVFRRRASGSVVPRGTQRAEVRDGGPTVAIPAGFFGVSFEPTELLEYERQGKVFDTALRLIRPRDGSPLLLRIGGRSQDAAYWEASGHASPRHPTVTLGHGWLNALSALVRRDGLRVMLSANLPVHSAAMAAAFASAVAKALPSGTLAGVAIGNEPDLYHHQPALAQQRVTTSSAPANWTAGYTMARYREDYVRYAQALRQRLPGIPLIGPDSAFPGARWVRSLAGLGALAPSMITEHRYAYSLGWPTPGIPPPPDAFLEDRASAGLARTLAGEIKAARAHALPLRVSEINSLAGGGPDGVANTFATALWAPDVIFEMARAGVSGVNWHIRPRLLNAPFLISHRRLQALPELYGLAVFSAMVGRGAVLEAARVQAPAGDRFKAWIVRSSLGVKVLLINRDSRPDVAVLRLADAGGPAAVQRLTAPSITATTGVTFGGQSIDAEGRWVGPALASYVRPRDGSYSVSVAGDSGVLLSVGAAR